MFIGSHRANAPGCRTQDAIERSDDFRRLAAGWRDPGEVEHSIFEDLSRHYWITEGTDENDEDYVRSPIGARVLRSTLGRRGITCIDIPSWDAEDLHKWWKACFRPQR